MLQIQEQSNDQEFKRQRSENRERFPMDYCLKNSDLRKALTSLKEGLKKVEDFISSQEVYAIVLKTSALINKYKKAKRSIELYNQKVLQFTHEEHCLREKKDMEENYYNSVLANLLFLSSEATKIINDIDKLPSLVKEEASLDRKERFAKIVNDLEGCLNDGWDI